MPPPQRNSIGLKCESRDPLNIGETGIRGISRARLLHIFGTTLFNLLTSEPVTEGTRHLDLLRPIQQQTAAYRHFGGELPDLCQEGT
jgi:hypothetical protein